MFIKASSFFLFKYLNFDFLPLGSLLSDPGPYRMQLAIYLCLSVSAIVSTPSEGSVHYSKTLKSSAVSVYGPGHAKTCLMPYGNNKGADQPAHLRHLISTFVVHCLDSMICIQSFKILASFCNLTWLKIPKDTFSHDVAHMVYRFFKSYTTPVLTLTVDITGVTLPLIKAYFSTRKHRINWI